MHKFIFHSDTLGPILAGMICICCLLSGCRMQARTEMFPSKEGYLVTIGEDPTDRDTRWAKYQLNGILSGWVNGSITSDDAGIACGQVVHKAITDAGLKYELPEDDCRVTLQKLPERMDARVLEIHTAAVECIVLAALRKVLRRSKPEESMKLIQYFCLDLGASWPSFIDLSKTLAEQILNSGKEKDIDHDDDRQLLLDDLHDPFLSAAAKALEKSAGADCRTPLYNHG